MMMCRFTENDFCDPTIRSNCLRPLEGMCFVNKGKHISEYSLILRSELFH